MEDERHALPVSRRGRPDAGRVSAAVRALQLLASHLTSRASRAANRRFYPLFVAALLRVGCLRQRKSDGDLPVPTRGVRRGGSRRSARLPSLGRLSDRMGVSRKSHLRAHGGLVQVPIHFSGAPNNRVCRVISSSLARTLRGSSDRRSLLPLGKKKKTTREQFSPCVIVTLRPLLFPQSSADSLNQRVTSFRCFCLYRNRASLPRRARERVVADRPREERLGSCCTVPRASTPR